MVVTMSDARARKNAADRERGLKRLEKRFRTGLLSDTGRTIVLDKPVCIVFVSTVSPGV